jgi:GAF domain-containing protein
MTLPKHTSDERRIILLDTAAQVARSVVTVLDPERLMQKTVDTICEAFGFYYAGVFLLDPTDEWAVLRAGRGSAGLIMLADGHRLKVGGNSMIGACIAEQRARIALDIGEEAVHFQNPHLPYTRSEMALPLIFGNQPIGALSVQSVEEAAFTQEDSAVLQSMADQLAAAIMNATLHRQNQSLLRQMERQARLLQAAHEVGRQVTSILDLEQLLPSMVDVICDAYGFYYAGIFLINEKGDQAVLRAGRGEAGRALLAEGHQLPVGGQSMIGAASYLREARIALDVGAEAVHFKNPHLPYTRSEMALPLVVGNMILGALTVQSIEERAFSKDDITTLQTMADQLAIAIRNAQLLSELKRAHAELLRTKTYEALAMATTEAVHWVGNKALPITTAAARMQNDLQAETLKGSQELDVLESLLDDLNMISHSANQIMEIKENLLGATRDQNPRPVLLADLWQVAAHERQTPIECFSITIEKEVTFALGDSTQLVRAFGNLLQNSLEAGASKISVEILPAEASGYVVMRLEDNGEGIAPENQEKVWTAFFTTKTAQPGSVHHGLGLPACLHVISQLDGQIFMESEPGQGTKVTILLPANPWAVEEAGFEFTPDRILLIDDDDAWAGFVSDLLSAAGKTVERRAAFDLLAGDAQRYLDFDRILVDDALRGAATLHVLEALQSAGVARKTLVVSAAPKVEAVTAYLQIGVRDVALKPYSAQELAELLG